MNMEMMKAAFADEAFAKGLMELKTAAEVRAALKEKGVELTDEESVSVFEFFAKVKSGEIAPKQGENGELSEEALEQVAGGGWGSFWDFLCDWLGHLGSC